MSLTTTKDLPELTKEGLGRRKRTVAKKATKKWTVKSSGIKFRQHDPGEVDKAVEIAGKIGVKPSELVTAKSKRAVSKPKPAPKPITKKPAPKPSPGRPGFGKHWEELPEYSPESRRKKKK